MAFTTIPGASATDATSFIGTEGVDILTTFATLTGYVEAKEANDIITLSNGAGLVDWTIRGLEGQDEIVANSDLIGGLLNGNEGLDNITTRGVFAGARVLGGKDTDTVIVNGSISGSSVNGNKGNDRVTVNGSVSAATVYGGQGQDTISVNAGSGSLTNGMIDGNLGGAVITVSANSDAIISNFEVVGGELADNIDASAVAGDGTIAVAAVAATATTPAVAAIAAAQPQKSVEGLNIKGLEGSDQIKGSGRDDTIEGGLGDDSIDGFYGADELTGGAGVDRFVFGANGGGLETWVGKITPAAGAAANPTITVDATDVIVDWFDGVGATGAANNTIAGFGVGAGVTINRITATTYKDVSAAVNANNFNGNVGANTVAVVAVASGSVFESYLLVENGAIKLGGNTYANATDATAANVIDQVNFVA